MVTKEQTTLVEQKTGFKFEPKRRTSDLEQRLVDVWADPHQPPWQYGLCRVCGCKMPDAEVAEVDFGMGDSHAQMRVPVTVCDECDPVVGRHYHQNRSESETGLDPAPSWTARCPIRYRDAIEREQLDFQRSPEYREIIRFRPVGGQGMVITGDSGSGKTVALWHLVREMEMDGIRVRFVTAVELTRQLARSAKELQSNRDLLYCPVLVIDDLGKERITASGSAMIWELFEERMSNLRAVIISTRFRSAQFVARFAEQEMGQDIAGRIKESCHGIRLRGGAGEREGANKAAQGGQERR